MINRLSHREKVFVFAGVAVLLFLGMWFGAVMPYQQGLKVTKSRIISRQKQLDDVLQLQQEYLNLRKALATVEKKLSSTGEGFSLFSFIEDTTTRIGIRDKLASMRPQTPQVQGEYREELLEIKLERIELAQLVKFLYGIEAADAAIKVKTVRIKPRFDNRDQLDTVLIISSLQRAS